MADRIPLIVNASANQIQELPTSDSLQLNDTNQIKLGSDDDFSVFHDGSNGSLNLSTGSLTVRVTDTNGKGFFVEDPNGGSPETIAKFEKDATTGKGRCELMFEGAKKFETTSTGVTITGNQHIAGALTVTGDITAFSSSDATLKENLVPISNALNKVGIITGYTYKWKTEGTDYAGVHGTEDTGVVAQDVELLGLPGITTTRENGIKAISYKRLTPILIQAIKELKKENDDLKTLIKDSSSFQNLRTSL